MVIKKFYTLCEAAKLLGKSKETLRRWDRQGKLQATREPISNYRIYMKDQLQLFEHLVETEKNEKVSNYVKPTKEFQVLELFAGAGGLAIGLEMAGLKCVGLNEIDKWACQTLRKNRPEWKVLEGDIKNYNFTVSFII